MIHSVNKIYEILGQKLSKCLPAYHALTGCDYTAAFARKGKIKPFKLLSKNTKYQDALLSLGKIEEISSGEFKAIEAYVCAIYGKPNLSSCDDLRLDTFHDKYTPKKDSFSLKLVDGCIFPPCSKVLKQKVKRTNLVAHMWMNSTVDYPELFNPLSNGWLNIDGRYKYHWFDGESSPPTISSIQVTNVVADDDDGL